MIRIEGLWKTYDDVVAVRDLDLHIGEGQTLGLIGPNGSGKTTLLRMITTLAKPDRGSIRYRDFDAGQSVREIRRSISFMPAEFGFPKSVTIGEYMHYFACLYGVTACKRSRVIDQVLELTDLLGREEVHVRGLSTGNRQRLLLAKTLLNDPDLLVLDEPASGLDPRARAEVREILKTLSNMGKTIIISSHILADIQDICSNICILEEGNKVMSGELTALLDEARTEQMVHLEVEDGKMVLAKEILDGDDGVLRCEIAAQHLEVSSRHENCNFILKLLIDNNIEICSMREDKPNLEDIFIQSTKGTVS